MDEGEPYRVRNYKPFYQILLKLGEGRLLDEDDDHRIIVARVTLNKIYGIKEMIIKLKYQELNIEKYYWMKKILLGKVSI